MITTREILQKTALRVCPELKLPESVIQRAENTLENTLEREAPKALRMALISLFRPPQTHRKQKESPQE